VFEPVADLCERIGLEPNDVARFEIEPNRLTVDVYLKNGDGKKYITELDGPALTRIRYPIRTHGE